MRRGPCGKVPYASERAAKQARRQFASKKGTVYWCRVCCAHHLSTTTRRM